MTDLTFLHGHHTPRCTARIDKRFDGYYTLQFISAGAVEVFYDRTRYLLQAGHYWPTYPGPCIRFHPAPGHRWWTHRYIAFCGPLASRWMADNLLPRQPQSAPTHWNNVQEFDKLLALTHSPHRWDVLRARNALERLLIELADGRMQPRAPQRWLRKTLERLSVMDRAQVDYTALASSAGMSASSLRRRFKAATGLSLHAYRLQCRISAARHLLEETDLPIKEIALKLGYEDIYFFTRQFHQLSRMPPAAYRSSRQT